MSLITAANRSALPRGPRLAGASCASSSGVASAPAGGRWSATRRRSGTGSECAGHGLKKSARRAAHHRLHRRKWAERAAPSGAHVGPARTDPRAAISFQLEGALGRRWHHLVELLFPALRRHHPRPAGGGLPRPFAASAAGPTAGNLGSLQDSAAAQSGSLSPASGAAWRWTTCRPTLRNSIRWSTSGVLGNIMSCLTSARMTSASSAITLDTRCDGCAAGPRW